MMDRSLLALFAVFALNFFLACTPTEEAGDTVNDALTGTDTSGQDDPGTEGTIPDDLTEGTIPDNDNAGCGWEDPNADDDGDGIPNSVEGCGDRDLDGMPDWLDTDSDGDGLADQTECPSQPCINSDTDPNPDYLDKDSDNDGLSDKEEAVIGTDPTKKDTDGDGSDDLAEIVYEENNPGGADPLDPNSNIPDGLFYVVLPYNGQEPVNRELEFDTTIEAVDIAIILDKSASMSEEMDLLGAEIETKIIAGIKEKIDNVAFGASWLSWDPPFAVISNITEDSAVVGSALQAVPADGDNEMHSLALYLTASGAAINDVVHTCLPGMGGCNQAYVADVTLNYTKVDCTGELGSLGGLCFRKKSMPIFIMLTDEGFTECQRASEPITNWTGCRYLQGDGVRKPEAITAMNFIGAKFIGIDTGFENNNITNNSKEDFEEVAAGTFSTDQSGGFFLYHTDNPNGTGISEQVANAVKDLTTYIDMDVTTGKMSDEQCNGTSAAEFIKGSTTVKADPIDGVAGQDDTTFFSVKQGTIVWFDVTFYNDFCKNQTNEPLLFEALVTVVGNGSYLSSRLVNVIVPPAIDS